MKKQDIPFYKDASAVALSNCGFLPKIAVTGFPSGKIEVYFFAMDNV